MCTRPDCTLIYAPWENVHVPESNLGHASQTCEFPLALQQRGIIAVSGHQHILPNLVNAKHQDNNKKMRKSSFWKLMCVWTGNKIHSTDAHTIKLFLTPVLVYESRSFCLHLEYLLAFLYQQNQVWCRANTLSTSGSICILTYNFGTQTMTEILLFN